MVLCTWTVDDPSVRLAVKPGFTEAERFEEYGAQRWFGVRYSSSGFSTGHGTGRAGRRATSRGICFTTGVLVVGQDEGDRDGALATHAQVTPSRVWWRVTGQALTALCHCGLTQARRSFSASLSCSVLGGLVLITGVALAIFRAESTGEQYASVTASVSGLLTTAIGVLFHRRADAALKHMESQSQSLRQDMKVERDARLAVQLLKDVQDKGLKSHLQAALILKFSSAKLPELEGLMKSASPLSETTHNGAVPHQQSDSPAT
ncbi:hypothetical protein ACFVW1_01890 [Streptomyces olivochromogenes]|uniref:TRADD-N-associated membrane domain-containing protein n=1 Tax=Streptomyces olivochromogenes TaxID=1963 RepID=UPI0036DF452A